MAAAVGPGICQEFKIRVLLKQTGFCLKNITDLTVSSVLPQQIQKSSTPVGDVNVITKQYGLPDRLNVYSILE